MDRIYKKAGILLVLCIAVTSVAVQICLTDIPQRDVAMRYAPMAEAFAQGDWQYAFHPRIQPLHIISGGVVSLVCRCDGFTALKIASALWFIAGMWIVWKLFREVYPDRKWIAVCSLFFYSLYPYAHHMASSGLRESSKTFSLLLIAWALVKIYKESRKTTGYVLLGSGCALAVLCRADMIMTGIFLLFTGTVIECTIRKFPLRSMAATAMTAAALLFNSILNAVWGGHAMPDYRFASMFAEKFGRAAQISDFLCILIILLTFITAAAWLTALILRKVHAGILPLLMVFVITVSSIYTAIIDKENSAGDFAESLFEGIYHGVGILSIMCIIYLICRKRFTAAEYIVCTVVLANAFFNIVPIQLFHNALYVSSRYLYVAVPLLAGFFVLGIYEIYLFAQKYTGRKPASVLLSLAVTALVGLFIFHSFQPTVRDYTRKKDRLMRLGILELSTVLQENYKGEPCRTCPKSLHVYRSKKAPLVFFERKDHKMTVAAYLAGGSTAISSKEKINFYVGTKCPLRYRRRSKFIAQVSFGKITCNVWRIER